MADPHANTEQGYHKFRGGTGSFEVFWANEGDWLEGDEQEPCEPGWYWHSCFPGCLPDGDSTGPFDTSTEAVDNALGDES